MTTTAPTQYDESRPHPYVDPLTPGGIIGTGGNHSPPHITVRNPIKRKWKNQRSQGEFIDWHATATDLAVQLHATNRALAVRRELNDAKNRLLDSRTKQIDQLSKSLEEMRENYFQTCGTHSRLLHQLWAIEHCWWFRLFAPRSLKDML